MTTLQQIASSQSSAEVTINENFETVSAFALYGKRPAATSGLVFGYYGGIWSGASIADGTLTLTASTTNYIVVAVATGVINAATTTTNWNDAANYLRCYLVVTGTATMTSIADYRMGPGGLTSFANASKQDLLVSTTNIKSINGASVLGSGDLVVTGTGGKELLTATKNYYVRTDGNDANDGLANTSGSAFLTIQAAVNKIATALDMTNFGCIVNVADGTYTTPVVLKPYTGAVQPQIVGSGTSAGNCLVHTTSASCFSLISATGATPSRWTVSGVRVKTTTSGSGFQCTGVGNFIGVSSIVWDACATSHMNAQYGGIIQTSGTSWLLGSAAYHAYAYNNADIYFFTATLTLQANTTFTEFVKAQYGSRVLTSASYTTTGAFSVTGTRFALVAGSYIYGQANTTFFPGTVGGTTGTQCYQIA